MDKLIIDSREKSDLCAYVESEASRLNIPSEKQWIEIGDYVYRDVCFEAKSTIDFLMSVINKRLWNQIDNMDRHFEHSIVIIHGSLHQLVAYPKFVNINIPEQTLLNKFYGAISKITLDTDTRVFWTESPKKAARLMTTICKMRPFNRDVIRPSLLKRITTDDLRIDMLCTVKGVSESKAKKIIERYGSIMEIGEATSGELTLIEGIGPTIAQRIIDTLNSEDRVIV